MLTARRSAQLESVAGPIGAVGLAGDITSVDQRQALASLIRERYGRLDVLVNNAGRCDNGPLEEQTYDQLTEVVDVNLVAVLDLCRVMAPLLFNSDHASVINISSVYGLVASRSPMAAYNATKGALVNFTRHLSFQWGARVRHGPDPRRRRRLDRHLTRATTLDVGHPVFSQRPGHASRIEASCVKRVFWGDTLKFALVTKPGALHTASRNCLASRREQSTCTVV